MRAGAAAGLALAAGMLLLPGLAGEARETATDTLMRLLPRPVAGPPPVLAVAAGEEDLARLGPWPWPRARWAALVTRLAEAGAAAIALDIAFVEPAEGDASLSAALAAAPAVVGLVAGAGRAPPGFGTALLGDPGLTDLPALPGMAPLAPGGAPGAALALPGARIRGVPLLLRLDAMGTSPPAGGAAPVAAPQHGAAPVLVPGLALGAVARALGTTTLVLREDAAAAPFPGGPRRALQLGEAALLPLPEAGLLRLHPAPEAARVPMLGAARLLAEPGLAAAAEGRVVLLGATAAAAAPLRPSVFGPYTPSLRVQAEAVAQLAAGWVPLRLPGGAGTEAGATVLMALLAAWLVGRRPGPGLAAAATLALLWAGGAAAALRLGPVLADPVLPALGALLGAGAEAAAVARRAARERAALAARFAHRLPPGVAAALLALPAEARLRPERRRVAVVITDIAGFSAMVRRAAPDAVVPVLNAYLAGIERIVTAEGGTLERLIGDGTLVVFGAPVAQPDHGARALRAARAIDRFAEVFRATPEAAALGWGETRIGVAAGEVLAGEVGGSRLTWTVCGDAANVAARLQELAKAQGCRGLVTGIEDAALGPPLGRFALRGLEGEAAVHRL